MTSAGGEDLTELLEEQVVHYRAVAPEYEDHALPFPGGDDVWAVLLENGKSRATGHRCQSVNRYGALPGSTSTTVRAAVWVTAVVKLPSANWASGPRGDRPTAMTRASTSSAC